MKFKRKLNGISLLPGIFFGHFFEFFEDKNEETDESNSK